MSKLPKQFNPMFDWMSEKASMLVGWIYGRDRKKLIIFTSCTTILIWSLGCYVSVKVFGTTIDRAVGSALFLLLFIVYIMYFVIMIGAVVYKRKEEEKTNRP